MPSIASDSDGASDRSSTQNTDNDQDDDDVEETRSTESESDTETDDDNAAIVWTGYGKRTPVLLFRAENLVNKRHDIKAIGERYHLAYKMVKTECKLLRSIFGSHGFSEAHPNSPDFNLLWTGSHLKPYTLRGLQEFQKVNHFPRSYEITRKDRLFKNIQRMQQTKGFKHFDFVPPSFVIPGEFQDFCSAYLKDKGPWIVKPIASSRGRGIFLVNHPEQVPLDDTLIISRYLNNPLLVDGFKFDLRLYVAVTSYDPIVVYLYEEGLTRFATVQYEKGIRHIRNQCMHLTNYSVNKKNSDYVKNDDPDVEDYGNKWSLGALLRYLRSQGKDTTALMMRIEDVIIKTLLSAELPIATACKMFMPFRGNCFELYGFDVLVDDNMRPWVLEVNLSPSLACDSPLDLKIKSNMMADLFSVAGFICQDPMMRKIPQARITGNRSKSALGRPKSSYVPRTGLVPFSKKTRPQSAGGSSLSGVGKSKMSGLTSEEIKILRRSREEYSRRGGWVRIFPSPDSWELYGSYLQFTTTHNWMLFQQLFPERAKNLSQKPSSASFSSSLNRTKSIHLHSTAYPQLHVSSEVDECMANALQRTLQYERKLSSLGHSQRRRQKQRKKLTAGCPASAGKSGEIRGALVQGIPENSDSTRTTSVKRDTSKDPSPSPEKTSQSNQPKPKSESSPDKEAKKPTVIPVNHEAPAPEKAPPTPQPVKPREATVPPMPKYNVVELLQKGRTMSKVQARFAFATYLTRVQHRLMSETGCHEQEDIDAANEQMDLVLRFLKRAAGNLQQPFKVIVPSRKLPINDRRRILAKQLGDFVHIYNKETDQLRQRNKIEKDHLRRPPSFSKNDGLDEDKFNLFVLSANESELEEVLTTYTKLNKSASIFLGSNSKSTYEHKAPPPQSASSSSSDTGLARRKDVPIDRLEEPPRITSQSDGHVPTVKNNCHSEPNQDLVLDQASSHMDGRHLGMPGATMAPSNSYHSNNMSSYARAVAIYSAKPNMLQARPRSASQKAPVTNKRKSGSTKRKVSRASAGRTRPMSATTVPPAINHPRRPMTASQREKPDGAEASAMTDVQEEVVMNAALQRIASRQQQRQYAAKSSGLLQSEQSAGDPVDHHQPSRSWAGLHDSQSPGLSSIPPPSEAFTVYNSQDSKTTHHNLYNNQMFVNSRHSHPAESRDSHGTILVDASGGLSHVNNSTNNSNKKPVTSASETFENFVADTAPFYDQTALNSYSSASGAASSSNAYSPSKGSTDYLLAQQQQFLRHQNLMEQSRALLQQSKAKHQAMVAQAHAAQKVPPETEPATAMQKYLPKPPPKPSSAKKPVGGHRLVRTTVGEDGFSSGHVYDSLRYDSSTGMTRSLFST